MVPIDLHTKSTCRRTFSLNYKIPFESQSPTIMLYRQAKTHALELVRGWKSAHVGPTSDKWKGLVTKESMDLRLKLTQLIKYQIDHYINKQRELFVDPTFRENIGTLSLERALLDWSCVAIFKTQCRIFHFQNFIGWIIDVAITFLHIRWVVNLTLLLGNEKNRGPSVRYALGPRQAFPPHALPHWWNPCPGKGPLKCKFVDERRADQNVFVSLY